MGPRTLSEYAKEYFATNNALSMYEVGQSESFQRESTSSSSNESGVREDGSIACSGFNFSSPDESRNKSKMNMQMKEQIQFQMPRIQLPNTSPSENRLSVEDRLRYPNIKNTLRTAPSTLELPKSRCTTPGGSINFPDEEKASAFRHDMTTIFSCIYGILLVVAGGIIYITNQNHEIRHVSEIFSICISSLGFLWMLFFHIDLFRYKRMAVKKMNLGSSETLDKISVPHDFSIITTFQGNEIPPYRFLTGRHSGSFYLKIGLAGFCFGHLIKEGLLLGQEILNFVQEDRYLLQCGELSAIINHVIKPVYGFYQLFIVFKYSNIVINRHKTLATFALMHIMGSCICYWFGTIVEDALEDYYHKLNRKVDPRPNATFHFTSDHALCKEGSNDTYCTCAFTAVLSVNNVQAIPYLYPFTIEFNLLIAGVWFIVWNNIGKESQRANPHHFRHKIQQNGGGAHEVTYQSNLVISADCHASNKGLFAGIFLLLISIISIIIFFVIMNNKPYHNFGQHIHFVQEFILTTLGVIGVAFGYRQLSKLDFSRHPIHFLDDVLLFVPLPFYFIQAVLTIMDDYRNRNMLKTIIAVLIPFQVILQTPMIISGLRRCSNSQVLRFEKHGREIVTFLIVLNLTTWIINTFEAKSVESHYGLNAYFGEYIWMFVSHTTLPLMLFYRFHSSVCLADIWKSAYEKEE